MVKIVDYRGDDRPVVPPVLIYADLLRMADDRNLETAEILYDQCIARLVQ